jgi:molybdopterin converting factor small subunit
MATVKLFGAFGDMAGWSSRDIDASSLGAIMAAVGAYDPRLADRLDHPSTLVIVNSTIVPHRLRTSEAPVSAGDELAFGPPVSGG